MRKKAENKKIYKNDLRFWWWWVIVESTNRNMLPDPAGIQSTLNENSINERGSQIQKKIMVGNLKFSKVIPKECREITLFSKLGLKCV